MGEPTGRMLNAIIGVIFLLGAVVPLGVFFFLWSKHQIPADKQAIFDLTAFLAAASWVQALIAMAMLLAVGFGAYQVHYLRKQTMTQVELAEREAYLPLISPEMICAKRLLSATPVRDQFAQLRASLSDGANQEGGVANAQALLDATRVRLEEISKKMSWPLLGGGGYVSLDHIEMLLNRYNYISKLIQEGRLSPNFATDTGADNFKKVYVLASDFIELRRRLTPSYASHFIKYCTR